MKTLMVYNSKGGSGKSTICTNLASYYAQSGMDVTIIAVSYTHLTLPTIA